MALVVSPRSLLAPLQIDPRLLAKARGPGRIRGTAEAIWAQVCATPLAAAGVLRRELRAARYLHSRERRLVSDGLYDLCRLHRALAAMGLSQPDRAWSAWLDLHDPDAVEVALDRPLPLALAAGVPDAAFEALDEAFGEALVAFLRASNRRAPVVLRANAARTDRGALAVALASQGIHTQPCPHTSHGLVVEGRANLVATAQYRAGAFELQDAASQRLCALVPDGKRLLDYCAGAGGKTLALAARGRFAELVARDVRGSALRELARRARRAGARVRVLPVGAAAPSADVVLVDAPCSGSGVWRRHPSNRWRLAAEPLAQVLQLQRQVLAEAAGCVQAGGTLVYATCSVLPQENDGTVEAFLAAHPAFSRGDRLALAPHSHNTDGMFAVALRRA